MGRPSSPPSRHVEILHAIVETYIRSGEPVASKSIAKSVSSNLSPATIRNVMAELFEQGYLSQPHTSAGRVPTGKAFRSYAQSLDVARLLASDLRRIRMELHDEETMEGRVERSSRLISSLTRRMGIVAAIPSENQVLSQIELISLADRRLLMVVAMADGRVQNRVISLPEAIPQEELLSIRNYINRNFSGWVMANIQKELKRRLTEERAAIDAIVHHLPMLYDKGLLDLGLTPDVHVDGASTLIGIDPQMTREKMCELFQALEEKQKILQLLERFLETPTGEVGVHVGLGDVHPTMQSLSLIGVSMMLPSGLYAKVAVLGPVRMDYSVAIAAVRHVSQALLSSTEAVA